LWWVDIDGRQLIRTYDENGLTEFWETPEMPGFVILTDKGLPAVGMESGIFLFDSENRLFEKIVDLEDHGVRFNDATVDVFGRLWVGTIDLHISEPIGKLYSVNDDRTLNILLDGLFYSNGLAVDHDRNRLYLSDSHPDVQMIWTVPCDSSGKLTGQRQDFVDMSKIDGRPDGAAIDALGNYWIAGVGGSCLHVFSPDALHLRQYGTLCSAPTKLTFTGPNLDYVSVTSKGGDAAGGAIVKGWAENGPAVSGRQQSDWRING
jgi:sugar lactone lactonase YvrE